MSGRRIPIVRSLTQRNLILGCEREPVLLVALFAVALVFVGQSLATLILGPSMWFASVFFLRRMAKADPYMSKVFTRHIRQQPFYSAKSRPWRKR